MSAIFSHFTLGATLGLSAAISPGPFQAFLLSRASRTGVRGALPLALAPLASDGPVVAVVLLALSRAPETFLRALSIAGGLFLLWLAWGTFRSAGEVHDPSIAPEGERGAFLRAALVNASGPGPWISWSTVCGPILVEAWRVDPARGLAFLAGFYLVLVGGNGAVVAVFGLAGRVGPRAARALALASAAMLAAMGLLQAWRGITGR